MTRKLDSDYRISDLVPFYGTAEYAERNREEILTSKKTSAKDALLLVYNLGWVFAISFGLEKLLR